MKILPHLLKQRFIIKNLIIDVLIILLTGNYGKDDLHYEQK